MIDNKKINEIKDKIVSNIKPKKIILFGSYAEGVPDESSDIDILVICDRVDNNHKKNVLIRRLFPHRDFSIDVFTFSSQDESDFRDIKGSIIYTAHTKGKILYEK